jgi:hypothetical protein
VGEPYLSKELVVPLLVKYQKSVSSKARVHFAVTIEIGCNVPRSIFVIQVQNHTLLDVDE